MASESYFYFIWVFESFELLLNCFWLVDIGRWVLFYKSEESDNGENDDVGECEILTISQRARKPWKVRVHSDTRDQHMCTYCWACCSIFESQICIGWPWINMDFSELFQVVRHSLGTLKLTYTLTGPIHSMI